MSGLVAFDFDGAPLRIIMKDSQPWFVLADVCRVLEIANPSDAASRLDDDEKNILAIAEGIPGNPNKTIINESGLYALILTSRKEGAKRFRKWVTSEVLPQIRKTGAYVSMEAGGMPVEWRFKDQNIDDLKTCISLLREVRLNHGRQAAQKLWGKLAPPLPTLETLQDGLLKANDSVARFFREMVELDAASKIRAAMLYDAYCAWCQAVDLPAATWTGFGRRAVVLGFSKQRAGSGRLISYTGIRLKNSGAVALAG